MRLLKSSLLAGALLVCSAAPAAAAERYAAPDGATSGSCASTEPCRIDVAVNAAPAGADVIVPSGDYTIGTPLEAAAAITLRGAGPTRPRLIGSATEDTLLEFREGGTVRHLEILASGPTQDALTLEHGTGEDLLLHSASGDAAKIVGSPGATVLRDTVAASQGGASLKLRDGPTGGDVALVNVTAYAPGGVAIRCETNLGTSSLVNTIARGRDLDVDASKLAVRCSTSHSNLRLARSPGLAAGTADLEADPKFVHAAGGNLRLADGSPLLDAGTTDPRLGAVDPDGDARILDAAPDIGAYEGPGGPQYVPPVAPPLVPAPPAPGTALVSDEQAKAPDADGDGTPDAQDPTPALAAPLIGRTVVVLPSSGNVVVRPPGATSYTKLEGATFIPTGSLIDTRGGTVALTSVVDATGKVQTGTFRGGLFEVRQARVGNGMTDLILRGGDFGRCTAVTRKAVTSAKRKPARRLWGKDDHGRFRTHGRNSVATARGTAWLTEDTCAGTRTRVSQDSVSVRPTRGGKARIVRAGQQLLVRAPTRPRR